MKKILLLTLLSLIMPTIANAGNASCHLSANETALENSDDAIFENTVPTDDDLEIMRWELWSELYSIMGHLDYIRYCLEEKDPCYLYATELYNEIYHYQATTQMLISTVEGASTMEELTSCRQQVETLFSELTLLETKVNEFVPPVIKAVTKEGVEMTFKIISKEDKTVQVGDGELNAIYTNTTGEITIPEEVEGYRVIYIAEQAFEGCGGLTSVTIPESVTSIGEYAFIGCNSLTSVTIPKSVTSIGFEAFSYCSSLISVTLNSNAIVNYYGLASLFGNQVNSYIIGSNITSIPEWLFSHCTSLTSVTIPNSVTSIGDGAFYYCTSLTSITIPNSVTSIGDDAFYGCSSLTSVTIPNNVTSIGEFAFYGCTSLTSITIPNSVTSIGDDAFYGCSSLTSVTIPNNVTSIGEFAFYGCSILTSIVVEPGNTVYDSRDNCNAIIETGTNTLLFGCKNTLIPSSVTVIGSSAFSGCSGLTSIIIPNSVTSIGTYAFQGCSNLTTITIPNSVTSINYLTFSLCSSLASIVVESGNTVYDSRDNCNAIIETGTNKLLIGCKNTLIPSSVTSIGEDAFFGCSGLTSVIIPNSVTSIGKSIFSQCSSLTDVYCFAVEVPETDDSFKYSPISTMTLHVPAGSIELYMATEPWSGFGTIVALTDEDAIAEVKSEMLKVNNEEAWYDLSGRKIVNGKLPRGINIIRMSNGTTRKVMIK